MIVQSDCGWVNPTYHAHPPYRDRLVLAHILIIKTNRHPLLECHGGNRLAATAVIELTPESMLDIAETTSSGDPNGQIILDVAGKEIIRFRL